MPREELEREVLLYVETFILPKVEEIEEQVGPPERPAAFVPLTARPSPTLGQIMDYYIRTWGLEDAIRWFKRYLKDLAWTFGKEEVFRVGTEILSIPADEMRRLLARIPG